MKWYQQVSLWLAITIAFSGSIASANGEGTVEKLSDLDVIVCEELAECIDQGDCIGFAQKLLEGQVTDELYAYLMQNDGTVVDLALIDAVRIFAENGSVQMIAALRTLGYFDDARFELYWKINGIDEIPLKSFSDEKPGVDLYLMSEIERAYQNKRDIMNGVQEMYNTEMLSAEMYDALYEVFGFDYVDSASWQEYNSELVPRLDDKDFVQYDEIIRHIDDGDVAYLANLMCTNELSEALYHKLMTDDADLLQFIVSQILSEYAKEGKMKEIVLLRANGYATDESMQYYWRETGIIEPDYGVYEKSYPGIDWYMLHELINIYNSKEHGTQLLNELWQGGIIDDGVQAALIDCIGFDYTLQN